MTDEVGGAVTPADADDAAPAAGRRGRAARRSRAAGSRARLARLRPRPDAALPGFVALTDRVGRRWWLVAPFLALLLWWPVGWAGVTGFGRVPLRAEDLDHLAFGAVAAGLVVGALMTVDWMAIVLVLLLSGVVTALGPPPPGPWGYPAGALVLVVCGLLGLALGPTLRTGLLPAATVLALVAALSPWAERGAFLAVGLALPFVAADRGRWRWTALACARVYGVWLLVAVGVALTRLTWPGTPAGSPHVGRFVELPRRLADLGAARVGRLVADLLAWSVPYLVVAALGAGVLLGLNALLAMGERRRPAHAAAPSDDDTPQAVERS